MKKERLLEFDILRGMAFIFIVLQHTIGGFSFRNDISIQNLFISKFMYTIAEIATPLFVCLTGVALLYRYYDEFSIKSFYIKKLKFLLLPFVIWSLFLIFYNNDKIDGNIILNILSGNAQYHLWYMGMILRLYLYFPLILILARFIRRHNKYIKMVCFILFTLGYWFLLNHYEILDIMKNFIFKNPTELESKFINITPLYYYYYFVIGAYIISNYKTFKKMILKYKYIVIIMYCLSLVYYYYIELSDKIGNPFPYIKSYTITSIFYRSISILFFYIISYYIMTKFKYIFYLLKFIGKYSFPAYLIHVFIINSLTLYIPSNNFISSSIKYLVSTILISISICFLLNYLPYSEYLIGVKSKFDKKKIIFMLKKLTNSNLI